MLTQKVVFGRPDAAHPNKAPWKTWRWSRPSSNAASWIFVTPIAKGQRGAWPVPHRAGRQDVLLQKMGDEHEETTRVLVIVAADRTSGPREMNRVERLESKEAAHRARSRWSVRHSKKARQRHSSGQRRVIEKAKRPGRVSARIRGDSARTRSRALARALTPKKSAFRGKKDPLGGVDAKCLAQASYFEKSRFFGAARKHRGGRQPDDSLRRPWFDNRGSAMGTEV